MSDPLTLLRNFVRDRKEFYEEDDKIIFGDVAYSKNVKTTYLIYGYFVYFCFFKLFNKNLISD
jgi:hypothetical protein